MPQWSVESWEFLLPTTKSFRNDSCQRIDVLFEVIMHNRPTGVSLWKRTFWIILQFDLRGFGLKMLGAMTKEEKKPKMFLPDKHLFHHRCHQHTHCCYHLDLAENFGQILWASRNFYGKLPNQKWLNLLLGESWMVNHLKCQKQK